MKHIVKRLFMGLAVVSVAFAAWGVSSMATAASPFYKGKTITVLVGTAPGGGLDLHDYSLGTGENTFQAIRKSSSRACPVAVAQRC
ncbi:MAG: hypothetical protein O7G88_04220 [bacterium]|nr:hypothetical protein [bacterium]